MSNDHIPITLFTVRCESSEKIIQLLSEKNLNPIHVKIYSGRINWMSLVN